MDIKDNLAALIAHANITQNDLARSAKVNQPTIHRILTGESREPRRSNVEKLAAFFGVSTDQLYGIAPLPENLGLITTAPKAGPVILKNKIQVIGQAQFVDKDAIWSRIEHTLAGGHLSWSTPDKDAYALRCTGDMMQPRIRAGEYLVIEPSTAYSAGDEVLIRSKDDRVMVKQYLYERDGDIALYSINENSPPIRLNLNEIATIHYLAGIAKQTLHISA